MGHVLAVLAGCSQRPRCISNEATTAVGVNSMNKPEYWAEQLRKQGAADVDWLASASEVASVVAHVAPRKDRRILVAGAGRSAVPQALALEGYSSITCVDFCREVVTERARLAAKAATAGDGKPAADTKAEVSNACSAALHWVLGDVRDLHCFPDGHFTVVVDKVLSDVLACCPGSGIDAEDGSEDEEASDGRSIALQAAHAEYARLLAPGGALLLVSGFGVEQLQQWSGALRATRWAAHHVTELPFLPCPQPESGGREAEREVRGVIVALRRRSSAAGNDPKSDAKAKRLLGVIFSRLLAVMQDRTWYLEHSIAVANDTSEEEDENREFFVAGPERYADSILTPREQRADDVMAILQRLGEGEPELSARYLCPAYWRTLVAGCGLELSEGNPLNGRSVDEEDGMTAVEVVKARARLVEQGYFVLEPGDRAAAQLLSPALVTALRAGVARIKAAGWPVTFLLLFDETWRLVARLFEVLGPVLLPPDAQAQDDDEARECLELDLDLFVWALEKGLSDGRYVSGNFATPHRDSPYGLNHDAEGHPTRLNVWVPLTDATLTNGCM